MRSHLDTLRRASGAMLLAACSLLIPISVVAAQQTCLPAHDVARGLVTSFLIAPSELTRRQAYGITAIRLEDLRPLTDAPDAALCQRMDSTITPHPVYYFSAGRYIIATNIVETVVWPDSFAFKTDEITRHVFLFDSAGYFAYTVGARMPAIAPTDLHAVSAYSGRVALAWTNGASTAMRYQLQRTSGGAAFVPIGPALLGSRTSTTDSTALADSTYRYRLDAVGPAGDSTYSNEVTIVPQGVGTITRTVTGLLFKDDFNRPNEQLVGGGKNWTRIGSPSVDADWQIQSNQAKGLSVGAGATQTEAYPNAIGAQTGDIVVQAWWSRANTNGRSGVTLVQPAQAGGIMVVRDPVHGWEVWNWGAGFYTHPADQA